MTSVRRLLRLVLLVPFVLLAIPVPLLLGVLTLGHGPARRVTIGWTARRFMAILALILNLRIACTGPRPPRPALLCPNHLSYLDVLVLGASTETLFVSRADAASWPVVGLLARSGGTLFLDRSRKRDAHRAQNQVAERLGAGHRVAVFLEGRASRGDDLLPFKSSLVQAGVTAQVPCVPILLTYALPKEPDLAVGDVVAWADDDTSFGAHAWRVLGLRRIDAAVRFLAPLEGTERKELTRRLDAAVRGALEERGG